MSDDQAARVVQPWQRPPFEPGHELSMRHGAYSERKIAPLAQVFIDQILPTMPHLGSPEWVPALHAWARAEARARLLDEYIGSGVGDLGDEKVLSAYRELHRAEARAHAMRGRLGLDPQSAARLGRDRAAAAVDVARLMAELEEGAES